MDGNLNALVDDIHYWVDQSRSAYSASGIPLMLDVAAFAQPGYTESSISKTLNDLRRTDGPLWLLHQARHYQYADVMLMVVKGTNNWECGGTHNIGSTRETAYMVVRRGCFSQGSIAHELGHLLGAHHNQEEVGHQPAKYEFGHGYYRDSEPHSGTPGFSTLMAYQRSCLYQCPRIMRFSDPRAIHNGHPRGTPYNNNVQAILLNYGALANYYPDPPRSNQSAQPLHTPQGIRWIPAL